MTVICGLCGYDTFGDFYVGIPGHPGAYMHSVSCGPVINGAKQVQLPTHRRVGGGDVLTYQRVR